MFGKAQGKDVALIVDSGIAEAIAAAEHGQLRCAKVQLDAAGVSLSLMATMPATESVEQDFVRVRDLCREATPCFLLYCATVSQSHWVLINWLPDDAPAKLRFAHKSAHRVVKDLFNHQTSPVIHLNASELTEISLATFIELVCEQEQVRLKTIQAVRDQLEIVRVTVCGVGERKLSIVLLSDTHNLHDTLPPHLVPDGDVLLHCGDFTNKGTIEEVQSFNRYITELARGKAYRRRLIIAGNHDVGNFGETEFAGKSVGDVLPSMEYLNNETVDVEGLKIYGCPWNHRGRRKVPDGIDILVTHEPPKGILDCGVGCEHLLRDVIQARPKIHVFGHVHPGNGFQHGGAADALTTTFVNAAVAGGDLEDLRNTRALTRSVMVIDIVP